MENNTRPKLSEAARQARNAAYRAYYAKNKDRIQQKRNERWERIAAENGVVKSELTAN